MATVVLVGTLDTKGDEYAFLRDRCASTASTCCSSTPASSASRSPSPTSRATRSPRAAGADVAALAAAGDRGAAVDGDGARRGGDRRRGCTREGRLDGDLGLGGSGGSAIVDAGDARAAGRRAEADGLDGRLGRHAARTSARSTSR